MTPEEIFKAGWNTGLRDGGEHDCQMFTPTAERAWEDFQFNFIRKKYGLEKAQRWRRARSGGPHKNGCPWVVSVGTCNCTS